MLVSFTGGVHIGEERRVGNLSPSMGVRNQVGIGLLYRPASLCSFVSATSCFTEGHTPPYLLLKLTDVLTDVITDVLTDV